MKVVLTGQKAFGSAVLDQLAADGHKVVAVVSPGREDLLSQQTYKRGLLWRDAGLPGTQAFHGLDGDVLIAAHSHAFIGARTRSQFGENIGYHPSLLPRHRGRDAVRWTIKMGDPIAGGSVYRLTNNIDAGPVCVADWCHVRPGWSTSDLWREALFPMGVRLLAQAVLDLELGEALFVPQDERCATWEPSWERAPMKRNELLELPPGRTTSTR